MDDAAVLPARRKLSVQTYYSMVEAGIFGKEDRIELIAGDLIDMTPIGQSHEAIVGGLNEALFNACAGRAIVWPQNSMRLDGMSAPQPDLAVLRRRADFYGTGERAGPADVLLLVEVADTSLQYDQTVKLPLYARSSIAEFLDNRPQAPGRGRVPKAARRRIRRGRDVSRRRSHRAGTRA